MAGGASGTPTGTLVNGLPVIGEQPLRDGDTLDLGPSVASLARLQP